MGSMTLLLLLLWVGVTVSTVVDLQKRIIGGQPCGQTERLYHVMLTVNNDFVCGGSLISDQWILTAAHCWEAGGTMEAVLGVHPGQSAQTVQITGPPVIFKDKDINGNDRDHDIMLLKLPKATQIRHVDLPNCGTHPNIGATVQIAGHAATTTGPYNTRQPGISNTLQCANFEVVDCQRLRNCLRTNYRPPWAQIYSYQHWFCVQTPGVDTSPGDSGGGVVIGHTIYGVHAFTGDATYACAEPAGFMDICAYIQWIRNTIARPVTIKDKIKQCLGCG